MSAAATVATNICLVQVTPQSHSCSPQSSVRAFAALSKARKFLASKMGLSESKCWANEAYSLSCFDSRTSGTDSGWSSLTQGFCTGSAPCLEEL
jgi:hypothetical protein